MQSVHKIWKCNFKILYLCYQKNINRKEESGMKEQREDQETRELFIAEVSIYTDECGEIQFHCLNDCLGGGAWLNIEY